MRLHTDFHDYYDHAVGYGIDDRVHYNRFTKGVEIRLRTRFDFPGDKHAGLLGFCGQIYPYIEIQKFNNRYDLYEYDWEELKVIERFYAYNLEEYDRKKNDWEDHSDAFGYSDSSRDLKLKQFFVDWSYQSDEVFLEHRVPIWSVKLDRNRCEGVVNPRLKDYGFDRIKDAFTAFQDISMYLSNILVEQKETAAVEDKFRIEQHGFDLKKSFRKEKKK